MKKTLILGSLIFMFSAPLALVQADVCISPGLSLGSSGASVSALQRFLVAQNYPGGGSWMITGYFGQATAAAVRNFQSTHGLPVTGFVDGATASAFGVGCASGNQLVTYNSTFLPVSGTTAYSYPFPMTSSPYTYPSYPSAYQNWTSPTYNPTYSSYPSYPTYPTYPSYPSYPYTNPQYPTNNYNYNYGPSIYSLSQNSGSPGQSITVYGTGFDSYNNTVNFGGATVRNISSQSGSALTFTIPYTGYSYGNGTQVQISVSASRGMSNYLPFTINTYGCQGSNYPYGSGCGLPGQGGCTYPYTGYGCTGGNYQNPTLSSISPSSASIGTDLTFYGTGFTPQHNTLHIGSWNIQQLTSSNGSSVELSLPSFISGGEVTSGTYPVSITNDLGYTTNTLSLTVTGGSASSVPVISSVTGPSSLSTGQPGNWTVALQSSTNRYTTLSVDWGDSGTYPYATTNNQSVSQTSTWTHTYYQSGTYTLRFTASDGYDSNVYTATVGVGGGSYSAGNAVSIANMTFNPQTVSVPRGTTVTWTNNDGIYHTVTSNINLFNSSSLATGQSYSYTFNSIGTYYYHCAIHPEMTGVVYVY